MTAPVDEVAPAIGTKVGDREVTAIERLAKGRRRVVLTCSRGHSVAYTVADLRSRARQCLACRTGQARRCAANTFNAAEVEALAQLLAHARRTGVAQTKAHVTLARKANSMAQSIARKAAGA